MADLPENLEAMKLNFVESMDELLELALEAPLPELKEEAPEVLAALPQPASTEQRPHQ